MEVTTLFRPWTAVVAALAILIWGYGGEDLLYVSAGAALVMLTAALACGARRLARLRARLSESRWPWPAAALMALSLTGLLNGANFYITAVGCAALFLFALAFLLTATMRSGDTPWAQALCVAVSAGYVLYGLAQLTGRAPHEFWNNGEFASRFVNSAHLAALVGVCIPVALGLVIAETPVFCRILAGLTIPINLAGLMLTRSRAMWLIAAAGLVVAGLGLAAALPRMTARRRVVAVGLLAAALAVGAALYSILGTGIQARVSDLLSGQSSGVGHRLRLWQESLTMIRHEPFGVGLGCFGEKYLSFKSTSDRYLAYQPHNEILQIVAEGGWLAGALLLWLTAAVALDTRRLWRRRAELQHPALALGLAAGMTVFLLHSLVDFPLRLRANALLFALLAGCFTTVTRPTTLAGASIDRPPGIGAVSLALRLLCLAAGAGWLALGYSNYHAKLGLRALDRLEYDRAMTNLDIAARWLPFDPDVAFARGNILYAQSLFAPAPRKANLQDEALLAFRRAERVAGSRAAVHLRLAWLLADLRQHAAAEQAFQRAIACDPMLGVWHYRYAKYLLETGRRAEAAAGFRQALALFHDSSEMEPDAVFALLYKATGDAALLERACPDDPNMRAILQRFLASRKDRP